MKTYTKESLTRKVNGFLHSLKIHTQISDCGHTFIIEPDTRNTNGQRSDFFDGMQIILYKGIFEISEYQAGTNANELHIYKNTTSLKKALKELLKGNKRQPIEIIN